MRSARTRRVFVSFGRERFAFWESSTNRLLRPQRNSIGFIDDVEIFKLAHRLVEEYSQHAELEFTVRYS